MKNSNQTFKLFFILLLLFLNVVIYSQTTVVKIAPISYAFKKYNIIAEGSISNHCSVQFGAVYGKAEMKSNTGLEAGLKYYTKSSIKGFYFYPHLIYQRQEDGFGVATEYYVLTAATIGYQFAYIKSIAIDLGIGGGYIVSANSIYLVKIIPVPHLRIGYAF
jgi:Protein of unknown function (DUF3575)